MRGANAAALTRRTSPVQLSVVSTLFCSAPHLREFYTRVKAAASQLAAEHEIILVHDGSPDNSLELAVQLCDEDARVILIDLSRNFGHHPAMMTGLAHARGELVFLIDSDLEEDPAVLLEFRAALLRSGADVVYGVQQSRTGSLVDRWAARMFYTTFNALSPHPLPPNLTTTRLMTRRYVRSLLRHTEREIVIAGLWSITGYAQVPVIVTKRSKGRSSYSFRRRLAILVDAVASFTNKPLTLIFYLGCAIVLLAGSFAIYLLARRLLFGEILEGWLSLIVSVWLLGGLVIFCLGVIGIYLSKIFMETKRRPLTIVRQVYRRSDANGYDVPTHSRSRRAVLHEQNRTSRPDRGGR